MTTLLLALAAGAVTGLALGALGGGGSVLAVPALIYLLGFSPAAATTASLVVVTVTSATALVAHARGGAVRWRAGAVFAAAGILPAAIGGAVSRHLPATLLTGAFAVLAAVAAVRMLRPSTAGGTAPAQVRPALVAGAGAGLGAVTGVLGVGGGFLAVPSLVSVVGLRMRAAVGTSLLVITINSLTALAARAGSHIDLDWSAVGPFAGAAILGAWDGKRLAARLSAGTLQRLFACALLAVAAFMLADAIG
ncbi:MAG: sulfite exporter TauE/SafE family protein [Streptomyces sp.]|uniref:sulfite exporter TauE/SafE family protein n=1 Tax=Streptomyces sp. TaxID=1931 RepID=UPI0025F14E23|nr:sulfite exporter TauE/SafE family protein [Streptomyces sp.]MBW8793617.1 sulfite exporter TauE/SafE family protein [Streptomyces sp.]